MKNFINSTLSYLLLGLSIFAGHSVEAQNYTIDDCGDLADTCDWTNDSCWNWDECCWDDACENPSRVYVGPVYYFRNTRFNHTTETVDPAVVREPILLGNLTDPKARGQLWGVNGGYEYKELSCLYFRADFVWTEGDLKGLAKHHLQEWILDGRIGYTWGECTPCGWSITPYVGIGYLWDDRQFDVPLSPQDPNRVIGHRVDLNAKYRAWFIPVGIYAEVEILCDFTAGLDVTWRPMFDCRVKTNAKIAETILQQGDLDINKGNLSDRYSWRIEVPLRWTINPDWGFELAVQPFWEYYSFGKVNGLAKDPASTTAKDLYGIPGFHEDAWGAKFLIGFRF